MKKVVIGIIIGTIVFGSIGVYATAKYVSKDVSYTKKDGTVINIDTALNELYINNEKYSSYEMLLEAGTNSTSYYGLSIMYFNNRYSKVKIKQLDQTDPNAKDCKVYLYSVTNANEETIELNKEYSILSDEDGYKFNSVFLRAWSKKNGTYGKCRATVILYN